MTQTLFLRSGFGPQGDDESRSQNWWFEGLRNQVPKFKVLLWELYAHQILRLGSLEWSGPCLGSRTLNKCQIITRSLPDYCQIITRSLKMRSQKRGSKGPSFQGSHFGVLRHRTNDSMIIYNDCYASFVVSEDHLLWGSQGPWFWGPGTKGPRGPKPGLWAPFVFLHTTILCIIL